MGSRRLAESMSTSNTPEKGLWLVSAAGDALSWFFRIQGVYLRRQPLATLGLIAAALGERVFGLLAFFLPLKVLLLAGSDRIPKYFVFFMEAGDKPFWLGVLALAAVVFYLLAVALEKLSSVISERAGEGVLKGANEIYVTSQQRREASTYFLQFATISASVTLVVLSLLAMGLINTWLPFTLVGLMALEFIFPVATIQRTVSSGRPVSESWMVSSWQGYLSVCRSINFLSGFGVLLAGFLVGAQANVIWAVLAIIILRQSLSAGLSAVGLLIGLYRKRPSIDPLTFRHSRLIRQDMPESRDFRFLFEQVRRTSLLRDVLNGLGYEKVDFRSAYRDGAQKGTYEFLMEMKGSEERFLLNVFSKQRASFLEHENLLFDYIDRHQVGAPEVLAEFSEGPFQCQLLKLGERKFLSSKEWQSRGRELYESLSAMRLPEVLCQDYLVTHQAIDERISEELATRAVVALDTSEQRHAFEAFCRRIPELRGLLEMVPLCLQNRDLLARNTCGRAGESVLVVNWQRWSIDRIGVVIPPNTRDAELSELAGELTPAMFQSDGLDEQGGSALLYLVREVVAFEQSISSESFNRAIDHMREILIRMDSLQEQVNVGGAASGRR